jgi:transcriptional regulator with XRE-family HTH domain
MSRFNPELRCGPCTHGGNTRVNKDFWTDPRVIEASITWDIGTLLRLFRAHTGASQTAVARLASIDQAEVSRLERGRRTIRDRRQLHYWAAALGIPDRLVTGLPQAVLGSTVTEVVAEADSWDDPGGIERSSRALSAVNVDTDTLTGLRGTVGTLVDRYEHEGPQALAPLGSTLRSSLHRLLDGRQHPRQRAELYALAAQSSGLLSYMAVNAGRPAAARAYGREALSLASEIEDPGLVAWIYGTQSLEAYYDGRYTDADRLAAAGVGAAPGHPQAVRLLVNGRARALARLGDGAAAQRAVGQALDLADRLDMPPGLTPCISFEPYGMARSLANAATVHVSLGQVPQVLAYADQVDAHVQRADSAWSRALVALDVATALLHAPDPQVEQAMALGQDALRSCGSNAIRSVAQRARELSAHAAPFGCLPQVDEYRDALRMWCADPAADVLNDSPPESAPRPEPANEESHDAPRRAQPPRDLSG